MMDFKKIRVGPDRSPLTFAQVNEWHHDTVAWICKHMPHHFCILSYPTSVTTVTSWVSTLSIPRSCPPLLTQSCVYHWAAQELRRSSARGERVVVLSHQVPPTPRLLHMYLSRQSAFHSICTIMVNLNESPICVHVYPVSIGPHLPAHLPAELPRASAESDQLRVRVQPRDALPKVRGTTQVEIFACIEKIC